MSYTEYSCNLACVQNYLIAEKYRKFQTTIIFYISFTEN